jgi:DNA-directed RNA polymerase specialized sigma24 family protein
MARQLITVPADADDVVADAFGRVLYTITRGGGPTESFRTYLLSAVRRVAYAQLRQQSPEAAADEPDLPDLSDPLADPVIAGLEQSLIARAFRSLPERSRAVLWHTAVEEAAPAEAAPLLGLTPDGAVALSHGARLGLRKSYLQMYLEELPSDKCRPAAVRLGGYARRALSRRDARLVSRHLGRCAPCRAVYGELANIDARLRATVAPVLLGSIAGAYLTAARPAAPAPRPPRPGRPRRRRRLVAAAGIAMALVALGALAVPLLEGSARARGPGHPAAAGPSAPASAPARGSRPPGSERPGPSGAARRTPGHRRRAGSPAPSRRASAAPSGSASATSPSALASASPSAPPPAGSGSPQPAPSPSPVCLILICLR